MVISFGGRGDASGENKPFPSPLEVNRFISVLLLQNPLNQLSFRSLSRWIGLYLKGVDYVETRLAIESPSPLEVYRFISVLH